MTTITAGNNNNNNFAARQFNKVAWRRALTVALAFGIWGTVAASDKLDTTAEAFGYTVGYGGTVLVMGAAATAVMSKQRSF